MISRRDTCSLFDTRALPLKEGWKANVEADLPLKAMVVASTKFMFRFKI